MTDNNYDPKKFYDTGPNLPTGLTEMTSQLNFEMILFQGDHFRHPFERPQQVVETGERVGGKVEAAPESSGTNVIKLFVGHHFYSPTTLF